MQKLESCNGYIGKRNSRPCMVRSQTVAYSWAINTRQLTLSNTVGVVRTRVISVLFVLFMDPIRLSGL